MVTYSMETIGYINLFERATHARVKDCFMEADKLVFVVEQGEIGKAVGKGGSNVRGISAAIKKPVKVIEFNSNPAEFLKTLLYPLKPKAIATEDESIIVRTHDIKEKGQVYGREKTNLKRIQDVLSRYFPHKIAVQ